MIMIDLISIGILAGFLTVFLNYCIGKPGSKEFSPYEVFSFYTVWLAEQRLKQVGLFEQYAREYNENINRLKSKHEIISFEKDFNKVIYEAAEKFFTWERAFGMCSVCFGFWVSLIIGFFFTWNFTELITAIIVAHITIRLLNKVI